MAASGSGAVFFLGTRAHYQVLQQPEARFDVENGNVSTETIYQNQGVQEMWRGDCAEQVDNRKYVIEEKEKGETNSVKRRSYHRRASETALCERDADMKPALLNNLGDNGTIKWKSSRNRTSLAALLSSLARRKRRMDREEDRTQYLRHIESALNTCTYRESCRCLDCQSRYFECDESDEYSSDDSEYARYVTQQDEPEADEVFVDKIPEDSASTDLLIDTKEKMSVSSDEGTDVQGTEEDNLHLEVAAGTPVLLNYLLHNPITCSIQ